MFVKEFERGNLPKYGIPDKIMFVDAIAKTGVGKLNKKLIREQIKQ